VHSTVVQMESDQGMKYEVRRYADGEQGVERLVVLVGTRMEQDVRTKQKGHGLDGS
jgi:hypothetical protein